MPTDLTLQKKKGINNYRISELQNNNMTLDLHKKNAPKSSHVVLTRKVMNMQDINMLFF